MRPMLLCLLALACADPIAPAGAEPFTPPDAYRTWWAEVEDCAGIRVNFDRVVWLRVITPPNTMGFPCRIGNCFGLWVPQHTIYLAAPSEGTISVDSITIAAPRIIRHEMLHDILQTGDHPATFDTCQLR